FAHALIREALYDSLTAPGRMQQHRLIGTALEEHYGADRDAHLAELAHHFAQAASTGVAPKAVDYAARAAPPQPRPGARGGHPAAPARARHPRGNRAERAAPMRAAARAGRGPAKR